MDIFSHHNYKEYLNSRLDDRSLGGGRGARSAMSSAIGCQTAYTAHVLRGSGHFSLEQAQAINEFLGHSDDESTYFLFMLQRDRAGTVALEKKMSQLLQKMKEQRKNLATRFQIAQTLTEQDQRTYYSSWIYAALHMLAIIPHEQAYESMAKRLNIPLALVSKGVSFLLKTGLLKKNTKSKCFELGIQRLHLDRSSELISRHHLNWRIQAMNCIEKNISDNLHYSSVITVNEKDAEVIYEILANTIQKIKEIVKNSSKETNVKVLTLDYFDL